MKFSKAPTPAGELDAFVARHAHAVWHYLRLCGCAADVADDLTQETFLAALRSNFDPEPEHSAGAYLRRVARFVWLRHRRELARDRRVVDSDEWLDVVDRDWERREATAPRDTWLAALRRCRDALRGRRSQVVALFYGHGQSRAEVARRLAMTEAGVKTLLQRVRADLRACVERALA